MEPQTVFPAFRRSKCRGLLPALLLVFQMAGAQTPFTCEDQFFLTLLNDFGITALKEVVIDPNTNQVVFQTINNTLNYSVNAAGYRSTDGFIYCVNPSTRSLIRLDASGNAVQLASLALNPNWAYFAGDITPDGRYLILIGNRIFNTGYGIAADIARVDLETPGYPVTLKPIRTTTQILDIAFHPVTGDLYGYDSNGRRLVRIDLDKGEVVTPFEPNIAPVVTGSLFFDAYGRLFAYGSPDQLSDQNRLYEIDINTGRAVFRTSGAPASSSDGCSCPYTIRLSKSVSPQVSPPCADVEYTFEIVNTSRRPQQEMWLEDRLPPGFRFVSVKTNPLGGTVRSRPGDATFVLEDINLPVGRSIITIVVNTGDVPGGVYRNQAVLYNLPESLGGKRLSDNLATLVKEDSTELTIVRSSFENAEVQKALCDGVPGIRLEGSIYAAQSSIAPVYAWSDGSRQPYLDVNAPGDYRLSLIYGCDTARVLFRVIRSSISIDLEQDKFSIPLGDSVLLQTIVSGTETQILYDWRDPRPGSVRCPACPETWARPFGDARYVVLVENALGCRDSAAAQVKVSKDIKVYFPNVFKPLGGAADNARFYPSGPGFAKLGRLAVFSRWGEQMFEIRDADFSSPSAGWDGSFRGQDALPGVYVWVAEVELLDSSRIVFSGDVTLVR
jgi:uncharacterized repeat protein (TIGR01451 family)